MLIDFHTHHIQDYEFKNIQILSLRKDDPIPNSFFTTGIHPWDITETLDVENQLNKQRQKFREKNCLGFGECGLDRSIETDFSLQEHFFKKQLQLASELKSPFIVIHSVKANEEVYKEVNNCGYQGFIVFHDYNGSPEQTQKFLQSDQYYFSYGKKLFQKHTKAFKSLDFIPLERLFFETDDSELSIDECYKEYVNVFINIDLDTLVYTINSNFKRLINEKKNITAV